VKSVLLLLVAGVAGCVGEIDGTFEETDAPDAAPPALGSLRVTSPAAGATFPRNALTADGRFVAEVPLAAEMTGAASVDWRVGAATVGQGMTATAAFAETGDVTAIAIARNAGGQEIGRQEVRFQIAGAPADACLDQLEALGVTFSAGPAARGIAIPVTVTLPLNGIAYKSGSSLRTTHFMDCELALSLYRAAIVWKARDITTVRDYGIYNYRCINQSVDPPCPGSTLSQHSFGYAIDLAGFYTSDGTYYSVNDDWVIDPEGESTCSAATAGGKDGFLHELVCALYESEIFRIYLTPNYNTAHRNHFHVDLTAGSAFIEKLGSAELDE
jgi:hypothetical protein